MIIGVHNQPAGPTLGGGEICVAVLAEALRTIAPVEIIHHRPDTTRADLEALSGADLGGVSLRYMPTEMDLVARHRRPWRLHRELTAWQRSLSGPYDLFVTFTHDVPPRCYARAGVFFVHFPMFAVPPVRWAADWRHPGRLLAGLPTALPRVYWNWGFRERIATYRLGLANSAFTRSWTRRLWGADCRVLNPPVDVSFPVVPKEPWVLSVGRFTARGHQKKQPEMAAAFRALVGDGLRGWEYHCVGGLSQDPADQDYYRQAERAACGLPVHLTTNLGRRPLRELFGRASIFWHAAGYGEDPEAHPELCEHFGIATAEAMAAGCVPVVINRGAQPELVEHGVTGFLWDTLDELRAYTARLVNDAPLRERLSAAARGRARAFSREAFVTAYLGLLRPLLPAAAG
jgi:glycosyltransferase involved in cell wall biosynthesis